MSEIRLFIITDEGEYNELPFQNKDQLNSEEVYLIVDESGKNIWIYKGANARIRKKFLGARAATELRQDIGFRYKVHSLDEGEDSPDFKALISGAEPSTVPKTIKKTEKATSRTKRKSKTPSKKVKTEETTPYMQLTDIVPTPTLKTQESPTEIEKPSETFVETKDEMPTTETVDKTKYAPTVTPTVTPTITPSQPDLDSVMKKLDGIEQLDGYLRELVIIGHDCYAVSEKSVRFLGEERVEKQLERITSTSMPEGIFFAEEYTPRIIVEDGKVIAIEFWKESELVSEQLRTQMTRSLDELTRFFKMIESGEKEGT